MPFLLLICLMTVCLPMIDWPDPPWGAGPVGSVLLTATMVWALLLAACLVSRRTFVGLQRYSNRRDEVVQRYASARTYLFFGNLIGYAICLLGFGWATTVIELGQVVIRDEVIFLPFGELLILAPFIIVQIGSWFFYYKADRELHALMTDPDRRDRFWSRWGYVLFMLRQQLLMVYTPLLLMMFQQALVRIWPEILGHAWLTLVAIPGMFAFFLIFPLFLPFMLGLHPLESGPVRDRLTANARRLGFRYSQIYHWETRGAMANAMVVGLIPRIRYVIFTDRLLEEMQDDEVDGVLGHEVGHAHHSHILYYAAFLLLSFFLVSGFVQSMQFLDESAWPQLRSLFLIAPVALMGAYMFAVFGFVSRRCERQADVFGCRAGSCGNFHCAGHDRETVLAEAGKGLCATGIAAFTRALRRVEEINGMARTRPVWRGTGVLGKFNYIFRHLTGWLHTWQHSTIPKRIAFLERIAMEPALERRFQKRLYLLKWGVMLFLIAGIVSLGLWKGWDVLLTG